MAVNLSPVGGVAAQFFTNSGAVLTGGKLYTYAAGTTTPQTTYTTSSGSTAWTNPIILDAAGRVPNGGEIWVTAGQSYKFVLTDSNDVLIGTYDNVRGGGDAEFSFYSPATSSLLAPGPLTVKEALDDITNESSGSSVIGYLPAGSGAVATTVQAKLRQYVNVLDFGAYNDGTHATENSVAIQSAIDYCQTTRQTLYFGPGIFAFDASLVLDSTASNEGIALVGDAFQSAQAGSALPSCTLRWTGGAANMFEVNGSYFSMRGFAVENRGGAINFFYCTSGQHYIFSNMDFVNGNGTTNFVGSIFRADTNNFGYSLWEHINVTSCADEFLYVDCNNSPNGLTPIEFRECGVDSNAGGPITFVRIDEGTCDAISINNCMFNQQTDDELVILNTSNCSTQPSITQFTFRDNEIDSVTTVAANRMFKLANTVNIDFSNNTIQGGGSMQYLGYLVKSSITNLSGNYAKSVGYLFEVTDAYSSINVGWNNLNHSAMLGTYNLNAA